ncbi:hypothetical protein BGZ49_005586 [Haplosporangium sp. Z 27]|nr:hypothetical protein BGZ49_005586 [Haplosporangium sp. Z 27]
MMRRVRNVVSKTYLVYVDMATYNLPTTNKAAKDWLCNQENIVKGAVQNLSGLGFKVEPGKGLSITDSFYSQVYINMLIKDNLSKNGFMQRFILQMVHAGCTIQSAQGGSNAGAQILKLQKEKQEMIKLERCTQIANAKPLTREAFAELCDIEKLEPEKKHAVERYRLMATYNLNASEAITAEWVKKYNDKWEKSVYRNLCILNADTGTNMKNSLKEIHQQEALFYQYCRDTGQDARALHSIVESRYIRLKYAVDDILNPCGFTRKHMLAPLSPPPPDT